LADANSAGSLSRISELAEGALSQNLTFVQREKSPAGIAGGAKRSVLAWQQDGVVGEVERDPVDREAERVNEFETPGVMRLASSWV
jgi:hypothetical protein